MKLKQWLIIAALSVFPLLYIGACAATSGPQQVVTRPGDIVPGATPTDAVPIVVADIPDKKIREGLEKLFPNEPVLIITTKDFIKPSVQPVVDNPGTPENESVPAYTPVFVPITPPTDADGKIDFGTWLSQALPAIFHSLPAGAAAWGPLAAYLIALIVKKRPREHLKDAADDLNPLSGGSIDFGGAYTSVKKAIGLEHTNETPEQLRAVADKLESEADHDDRIDKL